MDRLRLIGLGVAASVAMLAAGEPVVGAQYRLEFGFCDRLQGQYLGALRQAGDAGMTGQHMVEMDQIGRQLAQAQLAARRYGCNGGFLFFGPRPGPQCPAVMAQVNRLSRQLGQLRGNSFFFYGSSPAAVVSRLRDALVSNGCDVPTAGGTRTLCVRLCDGYYFPIEFNAARRHFDADAAACQSMYADDGQAELFVQSSDEVADATSLSGERYGDQSYAFLYRENYAPSCAAQLHAGLTALAVRYFSQVPPQRMRRIASAPHAVRPLPIPQLRQPVAQDPETLANAAGRFTLRPVAPLVAQSDDAVKPVRMVGPSYYADLFDLSKIRRKQEALRPSFSIVGPAAAAEGAAGSTSAN